MKDALLAQIARTTNEGKAHQHVNALAIREPIRETKSPAARRSLSKGMDSSTDSRTVEDARGAPGQIETVCLLAAYQTEAQTAQNILTANQGFAENLKKGIELHKDAMDILKALLDEQPFKEK